MLSVSGPAGEGLAADVTGMRPVASVNHHVLLQTMILRKGFAALLAHEALPALVLQQNVLIQILLRDHASMTDRALVLRLEMRPLLVHVKRIAVGAGFAADVADYRTLLVLEAYVQPHVTLHFESFAAVFATIFVLGPVLSVHVLLQSPSALASKVAHVTQTFVRFAVCTLLALLAFLH